MKPLPCRCNHRKRWHVPHRCTFPKPGGCLCRTYRKKHLVRYDLPVRKPKDSIEAHVQAILSGRCGKTAQLGLFATLQKESRPRSKYWLGLIPLDLQRELENASNLKSNSYNLNVGAKSFTSGPSSRCQTASLARARGAAPALAPPTHANRKAARRLPEAVR